MPCLNRKVRPAAQVAAADELDIMYGRSGGVNGLLCDTWKIRAFEPGEFAWATPAEVQADREQCAAEEQAAQQVRRRRASCSDPSGAPRSREHPPSRCQFVAKILGYGWCDRTTRLHNWIYCSSLNLISPQHGPGVRPCASAATATP
ncbi:hypothetical protein [Streptomyces sp. NPDC007355]|uniref:hypothetical protein n=1 Tax=Streptomyces sp. NPDC007355 TaxID=3364778 RepID=UPI0036A623CB